LPKVAAAYCIHDDVEFFPASVNSLLGKLKLDQIYAFVSSKTWSGEEGDVRRTVEIANDLGLNVELGDWESEPDHRKAIHEKLRSEGFDYVITIDSDEVLSPELLANLLRIAESGLADKVRVTHDTYWHSHAYRIRPRERLALTMMVALATTEPIGLREFAGERELVLLDSYGLMHHLSYAGTAERIKKKISTWSHRNEVVSDWFDRVWKGWQSDKLIRELHPTHPPAYGFVERITPPEILKDLLGEVTEPTVDGNFAVKPSVVIPAYGGGEDLKSCLESLGECLDLIEEVIVVDNASPDDALAVARSFDFVKIIANEENRGFAAACNQGAVEATSPYILFLNSDTIVNRAGLVRLIGTLETSANVAAAGPFSNYAGYGQQLEPTYTEIPNLEHFVNDFAARDAEDVDVDHLVGFCLLVRKPVFDEVGGFDESFGIGLFEDTELCYRILRAGYRMRIAGRSFVHHHGSRSLPRVTTDPQRLLQEKWDEDVDSGYASHLPGTNPNRVVFRPDQKPEERRKKARKFAEKVGISLCMIVKNEERVLADCLRSAQPFFKEIIVVDTGSEDRTVEIAESLGAKVFSFPWTDSFSEARNESLKHATGNWIFWMDADDTLTLRNGETILEAAATAAPSISGFVVPVQFVEEGPNAGTRVDHIKLFRNVPGLQFEGRIHEQILPSLRKLGGELARCNAVVHHSGYDMSEEGQARKRERDFKLLELDYKERPDHPFVLFNLGMTHHYTGNHEDAINWLRLCIEKSQDQESHKRKAYVHLAQALRSLDRHDEAFTELLQASEKYADDKEIPFHLGLAYTEQGDYHAAKVAYLSALSADSDPYFSSLDVGLGGYKTMHNLGVVARFQRNYTEAKEWWMKATEASPSHVESLISLFEYAIEAGVPDDARVAMEAIRQREGESMMFIQMFATYHEHLGGKNDAIDNVAYHANRTQSDSWRLVLARKLLDSGRFAEANPILHDLAERNAAEAAYLLGALASGRGDFREALKWMQRANELNPTHQGTIERILNLRTLCDPSEDAWPS
jgi:GT2 family glycosyltransferase/Tfp pilus assembly protein PilF